MLLLPLWVGSALANKADQDKPLVINADKVDVDDVKQSYQLNGDVLLIKGSMIAKGDKGSILVDPQGYQSIDLKGKLESPATMRQRREGLADEFMQGIGRDVFYVVELVEKLLVVNNLHIRVSFSVHISGYGRCIWRSLLAGQINSQRRRGQSGI
jgi:lipopolysaccharide export system protein LptA